MGGKMEYLDAIIHHRGTIFGSPGYAENWGRMQSQKPFDKAIERVENMRFVFERMEYSRVMRLENGLGDREKFHHRVESFAKIFDFVVVSRPCGLEVFEHSYNLAKARLHELMGASEPPPIEEGEGPLVTNSAYIGHAP
jgi:hypothetical protein